MASAVFGIDPGAKGAICLFDPVSGTIEFRDTSDNPVEIFEWVQSCIPAYNVRIAGIEDVHSIFGMSAKSNFGFGFNVGLMHGIFRASGLGLDTAKPKVWQKAVGVPVKSKNVKKEVANICGRLYPKVPIYGPRGGLKDGRSDALMIAHYFSLKY